MRKEDKGGLKSQSCADGALPILTPAPEPSAALAEPRDRAKAYFDALDQARAVSIYAKVSDLLNDAEIEGFQPGLEGALGRKTFNALYVLRQELDTRIRDQFADLRLEIAQ